MTVSRRLPGQPLLAIVTGISAGIALTATWLVTLSHGGSQVDGRTALLLLCLFAALILTYHFPVHVDLSSKVYMGSIVLYLIATLLPPAVATTTIGAGILAGELSVCQRTENHLIVPIIPTQVARWTLIGLLGTLAAHVPSANPMFPLIAAGVTMWSADILTGPLLLSPMLKRSPIRVMTMMVREGGVAEGAQYLIGLLGALVAANQRWALALLIPPAALVYIAFKHAKEMRAQTRQILEDMADMVDRRDASTDGHSHRVAELTAAILRRLGTDGAEADRIVTAARIHDIGKIGIPEETLQKRSDLTPAESTIMQTHAEQGADLLAHYPNFARVARIIRHHHEAWDGSGYPDRLKGPEIPFGSRVIAAAESYDDMTNKRAHRLRLSSGEAAAILRDGRHRQWDPEVVDALLHTVKNEIEEPAGTRLRLVREIETAEENE